MEDLSFSGRLALLPKFGAEKRTALHVQGQKAYARHYASEGRAYMSSWRGECQSDDANSKEEERKNSKPLDIDFGTPVLKPRVKNLAKSVIPAGTSKVSKTKQVAETVITVESSDYGEKTHEKRALIKNMKRENIERKGNKSKEKPARLKKKRVSYSSSNSSRAERLKERRDKKRARRAILKPPTSDKENGEEDNCKVRKRSKKVPPGFALMHGFTATNVGKERLTVKPLVSIGVFNKGKASAKTKATKRKGSRKKSYTFGYFSESRFLNNSGLSTVPLDRSPSGMTSKSTSYGSKDSKRRTRAARNKAASCSAYDVESIGPTSNSAKPPKVSSVVWDIELGKSLPNDNCSVSRSPDKQNSVTLDISCHPWAKQLRKGDAEQEGMCSASLTPPPAVMSGGSEGGGVSPSIAPSQSASRRIVTPPTKLAPEEENLSKYFRNDHRKVDSELPPPFHSNEYHDDNPSSEQRVDSEPPLPLHFIEHHDDISHILTIEGHVENALPLDNSFVPNDPMPRFMQEEFELQDNEHVLADIHALESQGHEFYFGADCAEYLPYKGCDVVEVSATSDEQQDPREDEDMPAQYGHRDSDALFAGENDDVAGQRALEAYASVPGEFEHLLKDDSQYFDIPTDQEDVGMEDFSQGGDGPAKCQIDYGDMIILDHDQDFESVSEAESIPGSSNELNMPQVHHFTQGRALLLGCSMQEDERRRKNYRPVLTSAEVDVAKRLRDHWLPQKL